MSQKPWVSEITDAMKDVGKNTALGLFRIVGIILASGIVGTIGGALVCLWYGAPLGFALAGGVLGIVIALVVLYALLDTW
ncbi:MAG: hypothetical protein RIE60_24175 [Roseovarius sp.]|uniref:hypothetical protein n=1 Tax=Roseovarius sp. TaxID=1486281 RepID=UPI0032EC51EC